MAKVMAGMTMSLDGFINDQNGSIESLNPDFQELLESSSFKKMVENTGAVIMGRNVYEMADPFAWATDEYEFQVPIFVLTHTPPVKFPKGNGKLSFTFVTDGIESAISKAKEVADNKLIQVIGGADTIQQCLNSGLCHELQIDIMPIMLGKGLKLFENIDTEKIKLERISVEEVTKMRTSILYKVIK